MTLAQKYAYTVYRQESFSKAAQKLFISQPSLSEMVKKLENELGFLLFDRSNSPVKPTPQGYIYMKYLEEAFENERVVLGRIRSMSEHPKRELRIKGGGFLSRSILPLACGEFLRAHGDVDIMLDFGDRATALGVKGELEEERVNIALQYSYDPKQRTGVPLVEEQYFLAFTKDLPWASMFLPYAFDISDILSHKKIEPNKSIYDIVPEGMDIIIADLYVNDPKLEGYINKIPRSRCRVTQSRHRGVYYDLMLMGLGCIFVTDAVAMIERHRSQNVLFVPIDNKRTLHATYKKGRMLSGEEQDFISVLLDVCGNLKSKLL